MDDLRKNLRQKRLQLNYAEVKKSSAIVQQNIILSAIFKQSHSIGLYIASENEIYTWLLIRTIWRQHKSCYLPIINQRNSGELQFIIFNPGERLHKGKYSIYEPRATTKTIAPEQLDLVIVPLVGFNNDNYRLGRGAGYYDRTFAYKIYTPKAKPFLLGVAYEWQKIEFKPSTWDVKMDDIQHNNNPLL